MTQVQQQLELSPYDKAVSQGFVFLSKLRRETGQLLWYGHHHLTGYFTCSFRDKDLAVRVANSYLTSSFYHRKLTQLQEQGQANGVEVTLTQLNG
ncbi:MAG: hypothetical protein AB1589_27890 [Cyanobacteriota bacterium]